MTTADCTNADTAAFSDRIARLRQLSRYADRMLAADPVLAEWLRTAGNRSAEETAAALVFDADTADTFDRQLRHARRRILLLIQFRDLNGLADLAETMGAISRFADRAVAAAVNHHRRALTDEWGIDPMHADAALAVVGMGKLGPHELNVSSDIDLVFIHPRDGAATDEKSWHEFHTQLGKRLIRSLDRLDGDGQVFRVDMRLRPFGDSGPLVCSLATLEDYFIKHARPWERYAWLKARALTGTTDLVRALDALIEPFVYRRYHDFGAIHEMRELHAQIRAEAAKRGKESDIKVGRGGIREVEFVAQIEQLIRGGREARLRTRSTREALAAIAALRLPAAADIPSLQSAYAFLRNLEHRLQYLDDAQTQALPANEADRQRIAQAMGFGDWAQFLPALDAVRANVTAAFERIFERQGWGTATGSQTPDSALPVSRHAVEPPVESGLSADRPLPGPSTDRHAAIEAREAAWRQSARLAALPAARQARLHALVASAKAAAKTTVMTEAGGDRLEQTFFRMLDLIEAIDKRETYIALLTEYPDALARLAHVCARSAWAADLLRRHPVLLDELTRPMQFARIDWADERSRLDAALTDAGGDIERQFEILRHAKQVLTFTLNVADLNGHLGVMELSDDLTALADMLLAATIEQAWKALGNAGGVHGFAALGYGKLGSKELGYASDLDLVFVFDAASPMPVERYARLAQRTLSWLTTMTAGGVLYEADTRLRPDGLAGLPVVSLDALRDYQLQRAWTWEHQALTRARWCAGDPALAVPFETIRAEVLSRPRDPAALRRDIVAMRNKMRTEKRMSGPRLDLKHVEGGIVDVEFIVQYLILAHAAQHSELLGNLGNVALLMRAAALGLLDEALAAGAAKAYLAFRERQHRARTNNESHTLIAPDELLDERRMVMAVWQALLAR